ncbi:hypothetical protein [Streptomyces mexicanus]|uniref:Uncharacterized protein n=1 Tax=Streptomyces mexicanus TaxID=178566 RepID=A0A7X1I7I3_9ACTN|nr:hypothetical protein [Streptomyces mexicanus]MBC2869148.1 hypothetical protein [Streptomyces mexicanus]
MDTIVSLHAEMSGDAEDAYPAVQVVESFWRQYGGHGDESSTRRAARPKVEELRAAAENSRRPWARAVTAVLDAVQGLIDMEEDASRQLARVIGSTYTVALEFDQHGLPAPEGAISWFSFEAVGQAAAADQLWSMSNPISGQELFQLRIDAGSDAMHYHRALKEWMKSTAS